MIDTGITNVTLLMKWFVRRREEYWMERVEKLASTAAAAAEEATVVEKVAVAAEAEKDAEMARVEAATNVGGAMGGAANNVGIMLLT
jgi:hypothetical protein